MILPSDLLYLYQAFKKPDGSRVYPATVLMCAFPRPSSTDCALLKHREVITLFHGKSPLYFGRKHFL